MLKLDSQYWCVWMAHEILKGYSWNNDKETCTDLHLVMMSWEPKDCKVNQPPGLQKLFCNTLCSRLTWRWELVSAFLNCRDLASLVFMAQLLSHNNQIQNWLKDFSERFSICLSFRQKTVHICKDCISWGKWRSRQCMWEALVEKKTPIPSQNPGTSHAPQRNFIQNHTSWIKERATGRINIISKDPRNHEHCKAAIHRG